MKPTPPAIPGLPVLGNVVAFMNDRTALFRKGYAQYGAVFSVRLATQPVAIIAGEEAARVFFTETDKKLRMDKAYGSLRAMFGEIAFTASPEVYTAQRHILHAPFKAGKMAGYVRVMHEEIQQWLDSLGDSGEMNIVKALEPVVQNVAAHAIMGRDFRMRIGREFWNLYADLNEGLDMILPPNLPLPKFRRRDRAKAQMHAIMRPIIAERRTTTVDYQDMLQDFATATYQDGRPVEDEVIIGLITALMFAGHETTVGQASWTIIELLQNPEFLHYVQSEIAHALPLGSDLTVQTLTQLSHVAWAVNETTRTHPSADMIVRYVEEEVEIGEYRIPAGWLVMLSAEIGQNMPTVFSCPEQFDPHRFAPEREEDKAHRFTITGFGGGMHKCTGINFANNEMMSIVALLLQQFDLELVTTNPQATYDLGASRPDNVIIRYQRKTQPTTTTVAPAVMSGCPVHHG